LIPILAAIDRSRFNRRKHIEISEAALVEVESSRVSQEGVTRMILETLAPGTELRVLKARIATD
jgi:hypothetical protein